MIIEEYLQNYKRRAKEIVGKMKPREKISQLKHHSKAIAKYGIPQYTWWNECLHGVARAGIATVFPQAIGLAATFSKEVLFSVADIISTEARAKHHQSIRLGERGIYQGLTFWSPNINIFRDPRWGRGQETYGEDPYLTSILGVAFIKGLQGDDEKYLKVSACAKHFAVHSGPEADRHSFNAEVSKKDLYETYLPAFKSAVCEANAESVMTAYNRLYGEACSASKFLLQELLRDNWNFDGHVVSDCGAIGDIIYNHKITHNPLKGVALALKSGLDLECGTFYSLLPFALRFGYIKKSDIDTALERLLTTRIKLGMMDNDCKYANIPYDKVACKEHEEYAITVAEKSIVLLKNNGVLPLSINDNKKISLFGYNATNEFAYLGNYFGTPSSFINTLDGLGEVIKDNLSYSQAFPLCGDLNNKQKIEFNDALNKAKISDIIIVCTGIDSTMEGEAGDTGASEEGIIGKQGDRLSINLPNTQLDFIKNCAQFNKKIIVLNFSGSCINFSPILDISDAILQCWYPGAKGGRAIANILFGKTAPSGKLPITFYKDDKDLMPFEDYSMVNRTYRYFKGNPLYPFGFGLSYTKFEYKKIDVKSDSLQIHLSAEVKNIGVFDGEEVIQVYLKYPISSNNQPQIRLIDVKRVFIKRNEGLKVDFTIKKIDLQAYDESGKQFFILGEHSIFIGGGQPLYSAGLNFKVLI